MTDLLFLLYPWIKALHVIAVITWMAGIFYLPRLFVYHAERAGSDLSSEPAASFVIMEKKLLRLIMNPSMIATWVFGLLLVSTPGIVDWSQIWPWTKAAAVLGMTWFHMWCARERRKFAEGRSSRTGRHFRMMNELPTLFLLIIVFSVILRF